MTRTMTKTRPFDIAEWLTDDEAVAVYLSEALETGDHAYVAHALGQVARARGMAEIARRSGVKREALYRALSTAGNPGFATILKVIKALDLKLSAAPAGEAGR
ncbi:MAG: putative addiction module antidote protein [Alphaproteobacteria bacterium]